MTSALINTSMIGTEMRVAFKLHDDVNGSVSNASGDVEAADYACLPHYFEDTDVTFVNHLFVYFTCVCVLIGLIGNTLSMLVFTSPDMRSVSSNIYLSVLAVSDSAYLITVLVSEVLTDIRCIYFFEQTFDVKNHYDWACKLLHLLMDLFADFSSCLVLAFTFERYLACYHAMKFRESRNTLRARAFCFGMFACIALSISLQHVKHIGIKWSTCHILTATEDAFSLLYMAEVFIYRIIPVALVAILNILIGKKVWSLHKNKPSRKSMHRRQYETISLQSNTPTNVKRQVKMTSDERHIQLTLMLIVVSSTYVVLYFPVLVHFLLWRLRRKSNSPVISYRADVIYEKVASMLYIAGFAINFFLYTLSCKIFREQLFGIFGRGSKFEMTQTQKADGSHSGPNAVNGVTDHDNRKTSNTHV